MDQAALEQTAKETLKELELWRFVGMVQGEVCRRVNALCDKYHGMSVNPGQLDWDEEFQLSALYLLMRNWT